MPDMPATVPVLLEAYYAFNNRDIDAVLALMTPDVAWPNGQEGGYVHGRDAVRDYWTRQWTAVDPSVSPLAIDEGPDGRWIVTVHQVVKDTAGAIISERMLEHIYRFDGTLVAHMEIAELDV